MAGSTKFIATDSQSYLYTEREDGMQTIFGDQQLEWIKHELNLASIDSSI